MTATLPHIDLQELKANYERDGFAVARGLFSPEEVEEIKETFEQTAPGGVSMLFNDGVHDPNDPLFQYPRARASRIVSTTSRGAICCIRACTTACRSFSTRNRWRRNRCIISSRPARAARRCIRTISICWSSPGTCLAAWTAIDRVDRENGGMMLVPGSHRGNLLCQENGGEAICANLFTGPAITRIPKGLKAVEVPMEPGDTLFFGGSIIHGSGPNRTKDRFRRSFIGHYAAGSLDKISKFYLPLVKMDGTDCEVDASNGGGACGQDWLGAVH